MTVPADRESCRSKTAYGCCRELSGYWCQVRVRHQSQARPRAVAAACVHAQELAGAACVSNCQNESQGQVRYSWPCSSPGNNFPAAAAIIAAPHTGMHKEYYSQFIVTTRFNCSLKHASDLIG